MPTLSDSEVARPKSWIEFEDICLSACELRWGGRRTLTPHGRPGQKQNGVDIYGKDDRDRDVAIQCKNTARKLSPKVIDSEVRKAEHFSPIESLFVATTADTDAELQAYVRNLSEQREDQGKFGVAILFWSDLWHDLSKDRATVIRHWPQYFGLPATPEPETVRRDRDIATLKDLLSCADIDANGELLSYAPTYIPFDFLEAINRIDRVAKRPSFRLYDAALYDTIATWLSSWHEIRDLAHLAPYRDYGQGELIFFLPGDRATPEHMPIWEALEQRYVNSFKPSATSMRCSMSGMTTLLTFARFAKLHSREVAAEIVKHHRSQLANLVDGQL
ncbi:hypothetical protein [Burkholderia ubonensis]|uniref:hypothetical protein n=1 Tax=Burkholderia ubonensis TaxID=101571 RepID=UPI000AAAB0D8|nr:hypothetical protein [Burkholderia ubonensis]